MRDWDTAQTWWVSVSHDTHRQQQQREKQQQQQQRALLVTGGVESEETSRCQLLPAKSIATKATLSAS